MPVRWDGTEDTSGYDVIVVVRWMAEEAADAIASARAFGQVVISDCDDWFDGIDPANAFLHPGNAARPAPDLDHYRAALAASTALTAATPYLAERLVSLGRPVGVVRNAIDLERWPVRRPDNVAVVVGWVGVTGWHPGDLETLRDVLSPYLDHHRFRFAHHGHAEGAPLAADLLGLRPDQVERVRNMTSAEDYPGLFEGIDIGIAPLRMSPFNLAKCLDAAVPVSTPHGLVPVGEVTAGDQVWTGDGWAVVEAVAHEAARSGYRVRTAGRRQVDLTPEHRMLSSAGWVRGGVLREGDLLRSSPSWPYRGAEPADLVPAGPADDPIVAVEPVLVRPVDIQVAGQVFVAGGLISHNSAVKGMEYAASGISFVAQATGEYEWFAPEAAARGRGEWADHLERLSDPSERESMAARLRARVEDVDAAVRWRDWVAALVDLGGLPGDGAGPCPP